MRGQITIYVVKRIQSESKHYKDKWDFAHDDRLRLISKMYNNSRIFECHSIKRSLGKFIITRDEIAFVRLVFMLYGPGDYCIRVWAKGKEKIGGEKGNFVYKGKSGIRVFWDGIITIQKTFYRRKNTGWMKDKPSIYEKSSYSDSEQRIGDYLKTKRSGFWYNF